MMARTVYQNARYFADALRKRLLGRASTCPSCGCPESVVSDRKYWVTRLVRCDQCKLLFRSPTTSEEEFRQFYQDEYSQGFTTEMPGDLELERMKSTRFAGTGKDCARTIEILRTLGCREGSSLLDFGCSWGYGSWQFAQAGYSVEAFEVSERRRTFAQEKLGARAHGDVSEIRGPYDVFYSSHVFEHIPRLAQVLSLARRVVRPGGWLVAITPNGAGAHRERDPEGWHRSWGFLHPLLLDDVFYRAEFPESSMLLASSPYSSSEIASWASEGCHQRVLGLQGEELLLVVKLDGYAAERERSERRGSRLK